MATPVDVALVKEAKEESLDLVWFGVDRGGWRRGTV